MMKNLYLLQKPSAFILFPALLLCCINTGCKKNETEDPKPDLQQAAAETMAGTWTAASVTDTGDDVSYLFGNFSLTTKADKTFTTLNGGNTWPASGSYSFKGNDLNTLVRSDAIEMQLSNLTANTMTLAFSVPTTGGRINGITGDFVFQLIK